MTAEKLTGFEQIAADAVERALTSGEWLRSPIATYLYEKGMAAIERRAQLIEAENDNEQAVTASRVELGDDIDPEGWNTDVAYVWRLVLSGSPQACVVYFQQEPDYQTIKAFARAAGVPVVSAVAERRANGE